MTMNNSTKPSEKALNYPDTYYVQDIGDIPQRAPLDGGVTVDVCVVGAGLAGLTTALELSRKGKKVVVLEAHRVGWGASGRNGGSVLEGFAESHANIEKKLGPTQAKQLHQLSRDGVEYVRTQIETLNIEGAIEGTGRYSAVRHDNTDGALEQASAGKDRGFEFKDHAETRKILDTEKYHHTVFIPEGFHIQPLRYVLGLATEIERLGGQILEVSKATNLEKKEMGWQVQTADGSITAKQVVLCTSGYDFDLCPKVSRAMLPIATYVMATEPMAEKLDCAIKTTSAISDTRRSGDYYRRLKNGRLLWGGRITTRKSKPAKLAGMLSVDVLSVYPQLGALKLTHSWEGLMGYSIHKMPLLGEIDDGLWTATAFGGHGLNTTAMAGCLVARAIAEGDQQYQLFEPYKPVWAGGVFGRIGVQIIYWFMRWRDRRAES
jgi:gamma-glutamylputrescine oxidase